MRYDFNIIKNQASELKQQFESYNYNQPPENTEFNPNPEEMNNYNNEQNVEEVINFENLPPILELSIKIPQEATKHNASEVIKGTEYRWNLSPDEITEINVDFERYNKNIILLIFGIFTIFLIYISRIPK